jgi:hypothetical protein
MPITDNFNPTRIPIIKRVIAGTAEIYYQFTVNHLKSFSSFPDENKLQTLLRSLFLV